MENNNASKYTVSFGVSFALASVLNALLAVAKEKSPGVMSGLQHLTGHHWISQVTLVLAVFAIFGWIFAQPNGGQGIRITVNHLIGAVVSGVLVGGLIIFGFYLTAG